MTTKPARVYLADVALQTEGNRQFIQTRKGRVNLTPSEVRELRSLFVDRDRDGELHAFVEAANDGVLPGELALAILRPSIEAQDWKYRGRFWYVRQDLNILVVVGPDNGLVTVYVPNAFQIKKAKQNRIR